MDRKIDNSQLNNQRKKRWLKVAGIIIVFLAAILGLRSLLQPNMDAKDFRTATVERAPLESTIAASGLVVPSFEQQINAPIATEIEDVLLRTGTEVKRGDLILQLNKTFIEMDVTTRKNRLALSQNSIELLQLELARDLQELEYDDEIKGLQVADAEAQLTDARRLADIGGATTEEVEQAQTRLQILQLEKSKLENELNYRRKSLAGRQREVQLAANIEAQEVKELEGKLNLTEVRAPGPGVITWVNENIGEQVPEGNPLVRIADLRSFQIEGSCSDRYADKIALGQTVRVRINDNILTGHISNILPAVANNTVEFLVSLEVADDPGLRPNMRLEIYVVTDRKDSVLRVKRGPAFKGAIRQPVFVVNGATAEKREIQTGISNGDYIELLEGEVREGDRIIISDMSDYEHLPTIKLQ